MVNSVWLRAEEGQQTLAGEKEIKLETNK